MGKSEQICKNPQDNVLIVITAEELRNMLGSKMLSRSRDTKDDDFDRQQITVRFPKTC